MDTFEDLDRDDSARHGIGGNNPPEPIGYAAIKEKVDERIDSANRWITERPTLTDADMADRANGFKSQLGDLKKEVTSALREAKKPYEEAAAAVDGHFRPLLDLVERAYKAIGDKLTAYMQEQQRLAQEEQRRKAEEARKQREEAEAAARRAKEEAERAGGDAIRAQQEAEAAARLAALAEREAAKPAKVQLRGDFGRRAVGLRTTWRAEVVDEQIALKTYGKHPVVRAAALKAALELATAEAKVAKREDAAPAGFKFVSDSKAA
jgi:hypothetical protein